MDPSLWGRACRLAWPVSVITQAGGSCCATSRRHLLKLKLFFEACSGRRAVSSSPSPCDSTPLAVHPLGPPGLPLPIPTPTSPLCHPGSSVAARSSLRASRPPLRAFISMLESARLGWEGRETCYLKMTG